MHPNFPLIVTLSGLRLASSLPQVWPGQPLGAGVASLQARVTQRASLSRDARAQRSVSGTRRRLDVAGGSALAIGAQVGEKAMPSSCLKSIGLAPLSLRLARSHYADCASPCFRRASGLARRWALELGAERNVFTWPLSAKPHAPVQRERLRANEHEFRQKFEGSSSLSAALTLGATFPGAQIATGALQATRRAKQ